MMSDFQITSMVLTSCQTQFNSNQFTECCLEITALVRPSSISWAVWVSLWRGVHGWGDQGEPSPPAGDAELLRGLVQGEENLRTKTGHHNRGQKLTTITENWHCMNGRKIAPITQGDDVGTLGHRTLTTPCWCMQLFPR